MPSVMCLAIYMEYRDHEWSVEVDKFVFLTKGEGAVKVQS